jgi:hypothetical protein
MTTLHQVPEPAPKGAPALPLPSESDPFAPGTAPTTPRAAAAEILPMLVESPAWPRVFPGL